MTYELPRQSPEAQGIASSAIAAFVDDAQEKINELHSFMLVRHGAVVAEAWWSPHRADLPHMFFSLSKSFTSTAIGLAIAEKRLALNDPVISFFPEDVPETVSQNLAAMQVRHLLSMSTGHAADTMSAIDRRSDGHWLKAILSCPVEFQPGTHFVYNTGATYTLSAIIQKVTRQTLLEYLMPRLFEPLGIKNPTWEMSPQGICTAGFGLNAATEAIARFGQLYLQKGMWNGKRLLPEEWVEEASTSHIDNAPNQSIDWAQGYGYQFWRCRHNAYRGDGAFGQYCVIMPDQDAVLAITGGLPDMQIVLDLVWKHLLSAMKDAPLPPQPEAEAKLKEKFGGLAYLPPEGALTSPIAAQVSGHVYTLKPNNLHIKNMCFDFSSPGCTLTIEDTKDTHVISCGVGVWQEGINSLFEERYPSMLGSAVWTADDTLLITLRYYETPFVYTFPCHFKGDRVEIDGKVNVSFGSTAYILESV